MFLSFQCLLSTVGNWDFNIFNLDKLTNGRALFHMGLHLFQEHNLIDTFQLDIVKLMRCFSKYTHLNPFTLSGTAQRLHLQLQISGIENLIFHGQIMQFFLFFIYIYKVVV